MHVKLNEHIFSILNAETRMLQKENIMITAYQMNSKAMIIYGRLYQISIIANQE